MTIDRIFEFCQTKPQVDPYLPDDVDLPKVPKQWIVNVCYSVIGNDFKDWVVDQMEERNAVMADKRGEMIDMDPMIAQRYE